MVRAIVLFRVSNQEIHSKVRGTRNVRSTFTPSPPWELGAVVEAGSRGELRIAVSQVRSVVRRGMTDVFLQPEETPPEEAERGPLEPADVLEGASRILKTKRGEIVGVQSVAPQSEKLAQEVLVLDFSDVLRMLRSRQIRQDIVRRRPDSVMRLMKAVRQLFLDLSKSFEGSVGGKEALSEISRDFEKLNPRDQAFFSRLDEVVNELAKVVALRDLYAKDARSGDFETEFVRRIRGEIHGD